jgi:hypothetical protein
MRGFEWRVHLAPPWSKIACLEEINASISASLQVVTRLVSVIEIGASTSDAIAKTAWKSLGQFVEGSCISMVFSSENEHA